MMKRLPSLIAGLALCCLTAAASADGRLLGTGGATQLEGAAGGGLVPWAVLGGYATEDDYSVTVATTGVRSDDYDLNAFGASFSVKNKIEFSFMRQELDIGALSAPLGIDPNTQLKQDIAAVKLRLYGDLIYGRWPQFAVGVQHKKNTTFGIPSVAGARFDSGTDVYISATRLFIAGPFGRSLLVNGTLRSTSANQLGLLGFGGDKGERSLNAEFSTAVLLNHKAAIGFEYRQKPDNLSFAKEDDWFDLFGAYFFNKNVSAVLAWSHLGDIATLKDQRGMYLSIQGSYW
ncbi:MAG: DUF3034 family protein [Gammaproteobacteria bacterium]